jgi:hypothetical protein
MVRPLRLAYQSSCGILFRIRKGLMLIPRSRNLIAIILSCLPWLRAADEVRVLAIGVKDYKDAPLRYSDLDAVAFTSLLEKQDKVTVVRLLDRQASREGIIDALTALQAGPPPERLFVFFSGHAEIDERTSEPYLMPHEADKARIAATGLSLTEFENQIKAVGAQHTIVFLDACHAGAALGKGTKSEPPTEAKIVEHAERVNERIGANFTYFLSASASEVSSEDDEYHQGIYTHYVLEALNGAADATDGDGDGNVTAGELKRFLDREVPRRVRTLGKPYQTPLVSGYFDSNLVLVRAPSAPSRSAQPASTTFDIPPAERERVAKDPELFLMTQLAKAKIEGDQAEPVPTTNTERVLGALNSYRWSKSDYRIPGLDAAICHSISGDGAVFASVIQPATFVATDLQRGTRLASVPLGVPSTSANDTYLDSCRSAISSDDRFAALALRSVRGRSRVVIVALDSSKVPEIGDLNFDSVAFGAGFLAVSREDTIRIFRTDTWAGSFDIQLPKFGPITRLVSEPTSRVLAALNDRGQAHLVTIEPAKGTWSNVTELPVTSCGPAKESIVCTKDANVMVLGDGMYENIQSILSCPVGCQVFSSGGDIRGGSWFALIQGITDPNVLQIIRRNRMVPLKLDEPVFTAQMLSNEKVIVVSRNGAVYNFSALNYVDCCRVGSGSFEHGTQVAAGSAGVTVVLTHQGATGRLSIVSRDREIRSIPIDDAVWVSQLYVTRSNKFILLAGRERIRVLEFDNGFNTTRTARDLPCGLPLAVDSTATTIVCFDPRISNVQTYSMLSGGLVHTLSGHNGPVQTLSVDRDSIRAAGVYVGRNDTLVSMWNRSDGKLLSTRTCPFSGDEGPKSVTFLYGGDEFLQLDSQSLLALRDSLTCELRSRQVALQGHAFNRLQSSPAEAVLLWREKEQAFLRINVAPGPTNLYVSMAWTSVDTPVEELSLAPDGSDVVALDQSGILFRIPVSLDSAAQVARRKITRDFSSNECQAFFPNRVCPNLLDLH